MKKAMFKKNMPTDLNLAIFKNSLVFVTGCSITDYIGISMKSPVRICTRYVASFMKYCHQYITSHIENEWRCLQRHANETYV